MKMANSQLMMLFVSLVLLHVSYSQITPTVCPNTATQCCLRYGSQKLTPGCRAKVYYCDGFCGTGFSSAYFDSTGLISRCICCKPTTTQLRQVTLSCGGLMLVVEATGCSCQNC